MQSLNILGVRVDDIGVQELHQYILEIVQHHQQAWIFNVNVHALNIACTDRDFRNALNAAELVFCDGSGVRLGAWILGHRLGPRITYADWMWQLAEFCTLHNLSLYFLGGRPGIAEKAAQQLRQRYPHLSIVGCRHGYFDKTPHSPSNLAVIETVNRSRADILVTGFGMPLQEKWLTTHRRALSTPVALTGGAVFDYISGELKRGPRLLVTGGFEWLGRLLVEPQRLWKRYILGNPLFIWRVVIARLGAFEQG